MGRRPNFDDSTAVAPAHADLSLAPGAAPSGRYARFGKRAFDVIFALATAPLTVPVSLLLAFLVALDGHAPFFRQERLGREGQVFTMWKLRSMHHDAEARLADYLEADGVLRLEWERYQKLRRDPRVTRLGRLLRASSLDELPQFWNVLRGEMSVVGPRPMLPNQRALYPGTAYDLLRPGITGPWQVSDRNDSGFYDRARFDEIYLESLSLRGDIRLCWRTVGAMFRATGF